MKLAIIAEQAHRAIIEHSKDMTFGITEQSEGLIVEDPQSGSSNIPTLNTCGGVLALLNNNEMMHRFKNVHNFAEGQHRTVLYGLMGQRGFGDMLEMTYSNRLFAGDIGLKTATMVGCGIPCDETVWDALPTLRSIEDTLLTLGYAGEVALGITDKFEICDIWFGHYTPGYILHTELGAQHPQTAYEMCLVGTRAPRLHKDRIALFTMLSYPPFPFNLDVSTSVKAPRDAERHLFRIQMGKAEVAYASACGTYIQEAKRRCRITIDNCTKYNPEIQYRFDYGWNQKFVLNQEKYYSLGGR